jgi:tol-pal system protein YbgF
MTFVLSPRRGAAAVLLLAGLSSPALAIGSGPVPPADIPGGVVLAQSTAGLAEQSMRMDRVEEQMRQLNGRLDEITWQLQQLQESIRRMQEDNEFRFRELEGGRPQKRSDAPQAAPAGTVGDLGNVISTPPADAPADLSTGFSIDAPGVGSAELGVPPQVLGTVPGDASAAGPASESALGGPLDLSAIARGDQGLQPAGDPNYATVAPGDPNYATTAPGLPADVAAAPLEPPPGTISDATAAPTGTQTAAVVQPADPRSAYDQAYGYVVAGDYRSAESSLKQFLADYPKDKLAGNAHFWLGEAYFARGAYRDAADSFLTTYRDYPGNAKAPESLLKLGLSLEGLGEKGAACATYKELEKKFPTAQGALLVKVADQKSKAGC